MLLINSLLIYKIGLVKNCVLKLCCKEKKGEIGKLLSE